MNEAQEVPNKFTTYGSFTSRLFISTLKLFHGVPVNNTKIFSLKDVYQMETIKSINRGFIFTPSILVSYSPEELKLITDLASDEIGLTPQQMNNSFHKSWSKVRDAPIFQLVMEQVFHYMTTYGYENLGIYDKDTVFIPYEKLEIPELTSDVKFSVIQGFTKEELKEKLLTMLNSGIALSDMEDIIEICRFVGITEKEVNQIKNREVTIRLYDELNLLPFDPLEFLRLMVFKATGDSLLIKNKKSIEAIKENKNGLSAHFARYDSISGYKRLAESFNRFKPLYLAFKQDTHLISSINKISSLSKKYHKTMPRSLLNDITGILKNEKTFSYIELNEELNKVTIFRKIRLLNALNFRINGGATSILYKVRNGKSYVKEFEFNNIKEAYKVYEVVLISIVNDLKALKGKKILIPNNIQYALPATVKQFTGNIPSGTFITTPKNMIFGIQWFNVDTNRIDLDLSVISKTHGKIGWDASYRSNDKSILFSGDVIEPTNEGATELFNITNQYEDTLLLSCNYYNHDPKINVPFKILVADEETREMENNYMVNPNNIKCVSKSTMINKQKILGLIKVIDGECRFYFYETELGKLISQSVNEQTTQAREYLEKYTTTQITLNDILRLTGVTVVSEGTNDIDLSPENVTKETFISLLTLK